MESWSKFHERHGSEVPKAIYGSYVTDPRQYDQHMSTENKQPVLRKFMSCLSCLVGGGGLFRSRKEQKMAAYSYSYDVENSYTSGGYYDTDPYAVRYTRPARKKSRPLRGNVSYVQ